MKATLVDHRTGAFGRSSKRNGMTRGMCASLVGLAFLAAYAETAAWMLPMWLDFRGHYSHALMVVAMVAYLLWQGRAWLVSTEPSMPAAAALTAGILSASAVWFVSALAGVRAPGTLAALVVGWLAIGAALGRGSVWRLTPIFALLLSVIPSGSKR